MEAIVYVLIVGLVLLLVLTLAPQATLKFIGRVKEDRIVESTRQARKIVTIDDDIERKTFSVIRREPINDVMCKLELLNLNSNMVEKHDVYIDQLKINLWEIMDTGFVNIRLLNKVMTVEPMLLNAGHLRGGPTNTKYAPNELNKMSEDAFDKWKRAESEVTSLKANMEQEINRRVDQVSKLTSSSKERNVGKGR